MGAVVHLAAFYPALVVFVVLTLAPLIMRDAWLAQSQGQGLYALLAVMTTFVGVYALLIGQRQFASVQELVRQRRETAAANDAKARFLAAASHDLRQPLQALALLAQTLRLQTTDAEVRRFSGQLVDGVGQMGNIVDELLALSLIDAGQLNLQIRALPLSPLLLGLVALHEPQARAKGLDLRLEVPAGLWVLSDEHHLRRVLGNLLPGLSVLCIEDDLLQAQALAQLLRQWGCHVRVANEPQAAHAELDAGFVPAALISDLRLADGEDGCHTAWALRRRTAASMPVLILTGDVGSAWASQAASCGLTVMAKPLKPAQLRAFLQHAAASSVLQAAA